MVALWSNETSPNLDCFNVDAYDINSSNELVFVDKLPIKQIYTQYSERYFDKRKFQDDAVGEGILCSKDGSERLKSNTIRLKPVINTNIIGYMAIDLTIIML